MHYEEVMQGKPDLSIKWRRVAALPLQTKIPSTHQTASSMGHKPSI